MRLRKGSIKRTIRVNDGFKDRCRCFDPRGVTPTSEFVCVLFFRMVMQE